MPNMKQSKQELFDLATSLMIERDSLKESNKLLKDNVTANQERLDIAAARIVQGFGGDGSFRLGTPEKMADKILALSAKVKSIKDGQPKVLSPHFDNIKTIFKNLIVKSRSTSKELSVIVNTLYCFKSHKRLRQELSYQVSVLDKLSSDISDRIMDIGDMQYKHDGTTKEKEDE